MDGQYTTAAERSQNYKINVVAGMLPLLIGLAEHSKKLEQDPSRAFAAATKKIQAGMIWSFKPKMNNWYRSGRWTS